MSPEQAREQNLDARTDLWNLGVIYYELLTGRAPFRADSSIAVLRAITDEAPMPLRQLRPDIPPLCEQIVSHALEKDPDRRYQSATEVIRDASDLLSRLSATSLDQEKPAKRANRFLSVAAAVAFLLAITASLWLYYRSSRKHWAREEAIPQAKSLLAQNKPLAAFLLLGKAAEYLPSDPQLKQIAGENSTLTSITSSPSGATVRIQDYLAPDSSWQSLGTTPLVNLRIPKGYFRWKVSKPGSGEITAAPPTETKMDFALGASQTSPNGMVRAPGGDGGWFIGFVGSYGPYRLPAFMSIGTRSLTANTRSLWIAGVTKRKSIGQKNLRRMAVSFRGPTPWRNFGTRRGARAHRPGSQVTIFRARPTFPLPA
jgi:eukaryotic-like serine/threonine-protein kinase